MQAFFREKLAPFFDAGSFDAITSSKRQLTYFLSYMASAASFWDTAEALRTNQFNVHVGSVLFEQMIMRSLDLCNKELRGNWRSFPHQFLILLDNVMQLLSSYNVKGFQGAEGGPVFRAGKRGRVLPDPDGGHLAQFSESGEKKIEIVHMRELKLKAPDASELVGDSPTLKLQLATAFCVPLDKLTEVLAEHKYILTFDFLMKMLHIRERRRALVPTIIEGETGVGKTKLLNVYAAIESISFKNSYNVLVVFRQALAYVFTQAESKDLRAWGKEKFEVELVKHDVLTPGRVLRAAVQAMEEVKNREPKLMPKFLNVLKGSLEGMLLRHPLYNTSQLLFFMRTMLEDPKTDGKPDISGELSANVMTTDLYRAFHNRPLNNAVELLRNMWTFAADVKSGISDTLYQKTDAQVVEAVGNLTKAVHGQVLEELKPVAKKPAGVEEVVDESEKPFVLKGIYGFARWCLAWMLTPSSCTLRTTWTTCGASWRSSGTTPGGQQPRPRHHAGGEVRLDPPSRVLGGGLGLLPAVRGRASRC